MDAPSAATDGPVAVGADVQERMIRLLKANIALAQAQHAQKPPEGDVSSPAREHGRQQGQQVQQQSSAASPRLRRDDDGDVGDGRVQAVSDGLGRPSALGGGTPPPQHQHQHQQQHQQQ